MSHGARGFSRVVNGSPPKDQLKKSGESRQQSEQQKSSTLRPLCQSAAPAALSPPSQSLSGMGAQQSVDAGGAAADTMSPRPSAATPRSALASRSTQSAKFVTPTKMNPHTSLHTDGLLSLWTTTPGNSVHAAGTPGPSLHGSSGEARVLGSLPEQPVVNTAFFGVAQRNSSKAEDRVAVVDCGDGLKVFGVFDGHGSPHAADLCAQELLQLVVATRPLGEPQLLARHCFGEIDARLGREGITAGTTATVLIVQHDARDGTAHCTLAWAGDSQAVQVDLGAESAEGALRFTTSAHTPDDPDEQRRMELHWRLRDALQSLGEADVSYSRDEILAAATAIDASIDEPTLEQLHFAFEREARIAAFDQLQAPGGALPVRDTPAAAGLRIAPRQRRPSRIGARFHNARGDAFGPQAVHVQYASGEKGVNLRTSRSIGDWDGPRVIVPTPEVHTFDVRADEAVRIVLASDGLWDVSSPTAVAKLLHVIGGSRSPDDMARLLVRNAFDTYLGTYGRMKDDTTVMVVDLGRCGEISSHYDTPPGCCDVNGCCTIS